tara:strand:+ start:182 stop:529 length:348 start_codon:yes stop_codon:yes gene_type:complete
MEYIGLAVFTALFISIYLWFAPKIYNILGEWANLTYIGIAIYPFGGVAKYLPFSTILITGVITIFVAYRLFIINEKKMREGNPDNHKSAEWAARFQTTYMWVHIIVLIIKGIIAL